MKAADFDYASPASVDEVCRLLAGAQGEARIIAGGQTLVPLLVMRLARPSLLVDVNRVPELAGIEASDSEICVRAGTRQADALAEPAIGRKLPLLKKALGFVGHVQTRNRGTIGGSLANADPAAEICLAAVTLDAELGARSTAGERSIAAGEFFRGPMSTALSAEECLTAARFPLWEDTPRLGTGFQEVSIRRSDFALAAAAVQLVLDGEDVCRRIAIGVGGAGPAPLRLDAAADCLLGTRLEPRDVAKAVAIVEQTIEPQADMHVSADYRRRVAGALVERAVAEARAEAAGARA